MSEQEEHIARISREYEKSMKDMLSVMDKITAEAKQTQTEAIDEIIKTRDERNRLEAEADTMARDALERRRKALTAEINNDILTLTVRKLIMAGRATHEISSWLELPGDFIDPIRSSMINVSVEDIGGYVNITQDGRGGAVTFIRKETRIELPWEFGGGKALALIYVPSREQWPLQTGLPLSDRESILRWIAAQVLFQVAENCVYNLSDNTIEILSVITSDSGSQ